MFQPEVLLFDEPLSNLDAKRRADMRIELSELQSRLGTDLIADGATAWLSADPARCVLLEAGV